MSSDRQNLVSNLYHAALARAPEERSAYLQAASNGDEALRLEVESLLAYESAAVRFLETPPVGAVRHGESRSPAMIGRQLGSYKILSSLGVGGMGEVYRARDTKLGREVAIKILPADFHRRSGAPRAFRSRGSTARRSESSTHRGNLWAGGGRRGSSAGPRARRRANAGRSARTWPAADRLRRCRLPDRLPRRSKPHTSRGSSIAISNRPISCCKVPAMPPWRWRKCGRKCSISGLARL